MPKTRVAQKNKIIEKNKNTTAEEVLKEMGLLGFDGNLFIENLMESVKVRQKRGKVNKQIRYVHYCMWARELKVKEIGPEDAHYKYPESILAFIRDIAPGDIIGEIREPAYKVTLETFCDCLGIPKQQL